MAKRKKRQSVTIEVKVFEAELKAVEIYLKISSGLFLVAGKGLSALDPLLKRIYDAAIEEVEEVRMLDEGG